MVKVEAKNYTVVVGSNLVMNCNGVINLVGSGLCKQPFRFREGSYGEIFLNCTILDEEGNKVLVLVNNIPKKVMDGYEIEIEENRILLRNKATGEVWLNFSKLGPRNFKLNGILHYPGIKIVATDQHLTVNGMTLSHNTFVNCENLLSIGPGGGIGIG